MRSNNRPEFGGEGVASRRFTRWYLIAIGVFALAGLLIGLLWVVIGLWGSTPRV